MDSDKRLWTLIIPGLTAVAIGMLLFYRTPSVLGSTTCRSWSLLSVGEPQTFSGQAASCFIVNVPNNSQILKIAIIGITGTYDFYVSSGYQDSFLIDSDKVSTVGTLPIEYVAQSPVAGYYTVAVVPLVNGSASRRFQLEVDNKSETRKETAQPGSDSELEGDAGRPSAATVDLYDVELKPQAQAIYPFEATCLGDIRVTVRAEPVGSVRLELFRPDGQLIASGDDSSSLVYAANSTDTMNGVKWKLVLTNISSSTAMASASIDHPSATCETITPTPTYTPTRPSATATPTHSLPSSGASREYGRVIPENGVIMFTGPGTNYQQAGTLHYYASVPISGSNGSGTWLQLDLPDGPWVSAAFLERFSRTSGTIDTVAFQRSVAPSPSYGAVASTSLRQDAPTTNYRDADCQVDGADPNDKDTDNVALLWWNVQAIPPGAVVTDAWLTLHVTSETIDRYEIYGVQREWREGEATWQQSSNGDSWQEAGARGASDRRPSAYLSLPTLGVGSQLISIKDALPLIQSWVNYPDDNYGIAIADSGATDGLDFSCNSDSTPQLRPKLIIEFRWPTNTDTPGSSINRPEIISNDIDACRNAKGTYPLTVSAVKESPWCVVYPVGNWGGTEFDQFVKNGQAWTWVKAGCEYWLDDDSDDVELHVDYSPKRVTNIKGTVDYVKVSCN
jgi:uncharacterized protein YraI